MKYNKFFAKSVFAFFVMSFVLILTSHAEVYTGTCGAEGHDLKWELNTEDSVLVISGTGTVMDDVVDKAGKRKKPWEKYKTFIACVELPSTLTHIGADMFSYCENLRRNQPSGRIAVHRKRGFSIYQSPHIHLLPQGAEVDRQFCIFRVWPHLAGVAGRT